MSTNGYFDLSSIFKIQSDQVVDLSNSYPDVDNASNIVSKVNDLQSQIKYLSSEYDYANSTSSAVLTQQKNMIDIVNTEKQRLLDKQDIINQAQAEQERKALLNTTYRKKYTQYSKIVIVLILILVGVILITLASRYFTIFPESVYTFLMVCVISVGIIYIILLYSDLSWRDNINYDEIYIPPPKLDASGNLIGAKNSTPSMWGLFNTCNGSACCSPGTKWDANLRLCITDTGLSNPRSSGSSNSPSPSPSISPSQVSDNTLKTADLLKQHKTVPLTCADLNKDPIKSMIVKSNIRKYLNSPGLIDSDDVAIYKKCIESPALFFGKDYFPAEVNNSCKALSDEFKEAAVDLIGIIKTCNSVKTPAGKSGFTTMSEAYSENMLTQNMENTLKQYWMGSTGNVQPNMDQRVDQFRKF
jgi:hypothetical protein